jgi:alkylation response protein AidB-like acyl-CoA dehydrogenase
MSASIETVQSDAAAWARSNWNPDLTVAEWWQRLFDERYALPSLPATAYGRGYSRAHEQAVWRGFDQVGALGPASGISTMMAAPTIAEHGTEAQIARYVPAAIMGQESWCQLFSEPGAGSDLAGLTTRADRDGDHWVINGQKVWTSLAHEADMGMLLARSNIDVPKHAGISWFSFPMRQNGVDIRPLTEITGRAMFNEVFLDDCVVADDAMIGEPGQGWAVGNTTLTFERGALAGSTASLPYARTGTICGDLERRAGDFAHRDDDRISNCPAGVPLPIWYARIARDLGRLNPVLTDELMKDYIRGEVNRLNGVRARSGTMPFIGNLGKLAMSEIARSHARVGNLAIGAFGMLAGDDATAGPGSGDVQRQTLHSPAPAIYGGTDQVQRNILGERALGLPKEPGPAKDTPFKDLPRN